MTFAKFLEKVLKKISVQNSVRLLEEGAQKSARSIRKSAKNRPINSKELLDRLFSFPRRVHQSEEEKERYCAEF